MVQLKLPPYWLADPDIWFAQVEAQFNTRGITQQKTKYDHVVASLSPEFTMEVRDIILHVPTDDPNDTLKQQLIKRTHLSEQCRLQQLFHSLDLGDRKPTQLLQRMRQLLGDTAVAADGPLIRELFLHCLPSNVRMVVALAAAGKSLEETAELADSIVDIAPPSVAVVSPPDALESLRTEVKQLTKLVSSLATRNCSPAQRCTSPRHSQPRLTPPPSASLTTILCWYHRRFGDRARNCTPPYDKAGNDQARC